MLTVRRIGIPSHYFTAALATLARRFGGLVVEVEGDWPASVEPA